MGIFSVVLPAYIHEIDEDIHKYYDVRDTKMTALEMASTLRGQGCDLIIALSHLGWENSVELAKSVPGIDIVINGHRTHNGMHHELVGETIVIDTGINRTSFTEIDVKIEDGKARYNAREMGKTLLSLDGDPYFLSLEKSYEQELEAARMNTAAGKR